MILHFLYEILVISTYIITERAPVQMLMYTGTHTYTYMKIYMFTKNTDKYLHTCIGKHMYRYTQVYTHTQTHSNTHTQNVTRTCRYSVLWFYAQFSHLELASISILYISLWCRFYYKIRY